MSYVGQQQRSASIGVEREAAAGRIRGERGEGSQVEHRVVIDLEITIAKGIAGLVGGDDGRENVRSGWSAEVERRAVNVDKVGRDERAAAGQVDCHVLQGRQLGRMNNASAFHPERTSFQQCLGGENQIRVQFGMQDGTRLNATEDL